MEVFFQDILSSEYELGQNSNSLTCVAKSLESSINFTPVDIACAVFGSFYLILILISGTILNTLVVYLVSRSKKLRTRPSLCSSCSDSSG